MMKDNVEYTEVAIELPDLEETQIVDEENDTSDQTCLNVIMTDKILFTMELHLNSLHSNGITSHVNLPELFFHPLTTHPGKLAVPFEKLTRVVERPLSVLHFLACDDLFAFAYYGVGYEESLPF